MGRGLVVGILALALLAPASASATLEIRNSDETNALLATVDTMKCKVDKRAKRPFKASGTANGGGYAVGLEIQKSDWKGFGHEYTLYYGDSGVFAAVASPTVQYSNEVEIPGTPPGVVPAGAIKLSANGKRVAVGAYGLSDPSFSSGVSLTGGAKCKYPKRR